jgi:hypothetical protein
VRRNFDIPAREREFMAIAAPEDIAVSVAGRNFAGETAYLTRCSYSSELLQSGSRVPPLMDPRKCPGCRIALMPLFDSELPVIEPESHAGRR